MLSGLSRIFRKPFANVHISRKVPFAHVWQIYACGPRCCKTFHGFLHGDHISHPTRSLQNPYTHLTSHHPLSSQQCICICRTSSTLLRRFLCFIHQLKQQTSQQLQKEHPCNHFTTCYNMSMLQQFKTKKSSKFPKHQGYIIETQMLQQQQKTKQLHAVHFCCLMKQRRNFPKRRKWMRS